MAEGCPTLDLVDLNSTPPAGAPAVRTPFIILFDGSAGSSWFAESLDRHPKVFIAGYEPLEWVRRPETYTGMNATGWQAEWLRHVWHLPAGAGRDAFDAWLAGFNANVKLDPRVHNSPLTVRTPLAERARLWNAPSRGAAPEAGGTPPLRGQGQFLSRRTLVAARRPARVSSAARAS